LIHFKKNLENSLEKGQIQVNHKARRPLIKSGAHSDLESDMTMQDKNHLVTELEKILNTPEKQREIGLRNTERAQLCELIKGILYHDYLNTNRPK